MPTHEKIDYLELPAKDLPAAKEFFKRTFGWSFVDYGPDYTAFSGAGIDGGFYKSSACSQTANGAALVVFYSSDLSASEAKIVAAGGVILKPQFAFPGGKRFHFADPNGNEYAVWSDAS